MSLESFGNLLVSVGRRQFSAETKDNLFDQRINKRGARRKLQICIKVSENNKLPRRLFVPAATSHKLVKRQWAELAKVRSIGRRTLSEPLIHEVGVVAHFNWQLITTHCFTPLHMTRVAHVALVTAEWLADWRLRGKSKPRTSDYNWIKRWWMKTKLSKRKFYFIM